MSELSFESTTDLLEFNKESVCEILKKYNRKPSDLQEDIERLKKWIHEQPHLPYCPSDKCITSFLILNKFSIEKTKAKLDISMTIKSVIPEFYEGLYPSTPEVRKTFLNMCFIPLPKMSKEMTRVTYIILRPMENANLTMYFSLIVIMMEMLVLLDYTDCHEYIADYSEVTFDLIKLFTPTDFKRGANVLEKVYSNRLKALRFVNVPPYAEWILILLKKILKPKMGDRIHVHSGYDALLECYGKEVLPVDLGGTERPIAELKGQKGWQKLLDDHEDYFMKTRTVFVDESKRPEKLVDDDILGFHGNFRKLAVD